MAQWNYRQVRRNCQVQAQIQSDADEQQNPGLDCCGNAGQLQNFQEYQQHSDHRGGNGIQQVKPQYTQREHLRHRTYAQGRHDQEQVSENWGQGVAQPYEAAQREESDGLGAYAREKVPPERSADGSCSWRTNSQSDERFRKAQEVSKQLQKRRREEIRAMDARMCAEQARERQDKQLQVLQREQRLQQERVKQLEKLRAAREKRSREMEQLLVGKTPAVVERGLQQWQQAEERKALEACGRQEAELKAAESIRQRYEQNLDVRGCYNGPVAQGPAQHRLGLRRRYSSQPALCGRQLRELPSQRAEPQAHLPRAISPVRARREALGPRGRRWECPVGKSGQQLAEDGGCSGVGERQRALWQEARVPQHADRATAALPQQYQDRPEVEIPCACRRFESCNDDASEFRGSCQAGAIALQEAADSRPVGAKSSVRTPRAGCPEMPAFRQKSTERGQDCGGDCRMHVGATRGIGDNYENVLLSQYSWAEESETFSQQSPPDQHQRKSTE